MPIAMPGSGSLAPNGNPPPPAAHHSASIPYPNAHSAAHTSTRLMPSTVDPDPTAHHLPNGRSRAAPTRDVPPFGIARRPRHCTYAERVTNEVGPLATVPLAVATVAVAVVLVAGRHRAHAPATAAAVASLAATATVLIRHPSYGELAGTLGLAECGLLAVLTAVVARWSPRRPAVLAVTATVLAAALCVLRFLPSTSLIGTLGACVLWAGAPAVALIVGGYPRLAEERRLRAVASARRAQQLALARDIHDFVAHDVSGIVVQAQSARFAGDLAAMSEALERIEAAGLQALDVLDRTVHTLRADDTLGGLADLPALVRRFDESMPATVDLDLADDAHAPHDVGATAYRVVTEALTNVRRHALTTPTVHIDVRQAGGNALAVTVVNEKPAHRRASRPRTGGGSGLSGLRERVALLGGTFEAGPHRGGWRVTAVLPWERP
jgi:signal transduction histidine kinase